MGQYLRDLRYVRHLRTFPKHRPWLQTNFDSRRRHPILTWLLSSTSDRKAIEDWIGDREKQLDDDLHALLPIDIRHITNVAPMINVAVLDVFIVVSMYCVSHFESVAYDKELITEHSLLAYIKEILGCFGIPDISLFDIDVNLQSAPSIVTTLFHYLYELCNRRWPDRMIGCRLDLKTFIRSFIECKKAWFKG